MTSVDSGVETGNDSNDGTTIQQEGQQQVPNQVTGSDVMAVDSRGEFSNLNLYDWSALMQPLFVPNKKTTAETGRSSNNKMFEMIRNTNKASELLKPSDLCYRKIKERIWRRKGMGRGHAFAPNNWQTERIQRRMRWAATINNITLMKRLLEFGVSPNYHDKHGRSPLHISACRGYTEIVSLLLENGADPNQRDCIGNTPLHLAVINNRLSVVKPLLTAGTDVLALDSYGYNPLQLAKTKLRMLQRNYNNDDMKEMHNVINMLMAYLQKQKNLQEVAEELSSFCSRLSLSNILDQFQDDDVKDLL